MRRAWRLLPLALLAACVDFVEVTAPPPPEPRPAVASLTLQVGDWTRADAGDTLFVTGYAAPGRAQDGGVRAFADEGVRVAGVSLSPEVRPEESRVYGAAFALPAAVRAGGPLDVRMPVLAGGEAPAFRLYQARRLDGDTLRIATGQDLVLRLSPTPADASEPVAASWSLALRAAGGGHVGLSAEGAVPAEIRIPAGWLPAGAAQGLTVHLAVSRHVQSGTPESPYQTVVSSTQFLAWTVLVSP